jgi:hypothetical protein
MFASLIEYVPVHATMFFWGKGLKVYWGLRHEHAVDFPILCPSSNHFSLT